MNTSIEKEQLKALVRQTMISVLEKDVYGSSGRVPAGQQRDVPWPWAGLAPVRKRPRVLR